MTLETLTALETALENSNLEYLLNQVLENQDDNKSYGLSFNVESNELRFIPYLTNEDKSFESVFESQNPCIIVGYVNYNDALMGDPASEISERIKYQQSHI
jgi:hypothetical protein